MRSLARALASFAAAALLVGGLITILVVLADLARGRLGARGAIAALVAVLVVVGLVRLVPGRRLLGGYAGLVYVFLFAPILVVVVYAFNTGRQVAVWDGFSTHWFGDALSNPAITDAIVRSLEIAAVNMVVSTALGTSAALALARTGPRSRVPFDVLVFLTLVVPELVIAIATLIFFVNLNFTLGPVTMFLGHAVFNTSLVLLIVRARFVSMGSTLEEAAFDLGASPLAAFRQVTLPRLLPAVVSGALLAFTFSFDDVVLSQFTSSASSQTWPLYVLNAIKFGVKPDLNATATMMLGVTLLALGLGYLALRRVARAGGEEAALPVGR